MAHGDVVGRHRAARARVRGFAYLWLLFFVAAMGASLAAGGVVWEVRVRREKEADLLFMGAEIRRAIAEYHRLTPQAAKELPVTLEDLVDDKRGPSVRRHLRRVYADPLTGRAEWGQVKVQGRLIGVYSLARGVPVRQGGFAEEDIGFSGARAYADWRFVAQVPMPATPQASARGAAPADQAVPPATAPPTPLAEPAPASPGTSLLREDAIR